MNFHIYLLALLATTSSVRSDLCSDVLGEINSIREGHKAPPLKCNDTISGEAQALADWIFSNPDPESSVMTARSKLTREENEEPAYGFTLWASEIKEGSSKTDGVRAAIASWYAEEACYDYDNPGHTSCKEECIEADSEEEDIKFCRTWTVSFQQLVWRASTDLGVGVSISKVQPDGRQFVFVANFYSPPGLIEGQYEDNVLPKA